MRKSLFRKCQSTRSMQHNTFFCSTWFGLYCIITFEQMATHKHLRSILGCWTHEGHTLDTYQWSRSAQHSKLHCRAINMITFRNFHLSFTSIFSVISLSKLKIKDSFEICSSWGFQNCPWFSILTKNWLRKWQIKISESDHVYRTTVYSTLFTILLKLERVLFLLDFSFTIDVVIITFC